MASILESLDRLGLEHPHKLLYSYLDLNGNSIESYSYASFLRRTKAIAGHLLQEGRFAPQDRLLLAYPPGLEMICAFFGCVRAGIIPVPVYPPSSRGFQSALYKMVHIARDCQAGGILTSRDYHASLKTNLARSGVSASGVDVDYISSLPWIVTENFVEPAANQLPSTDSNILFLQYTSGSTMEPKGVMVTHQNILDTCPARHRSSVAGSGLLASAVPRYGFDRLLSLPRAARRNHLRLLSHRFHPAPDAVVRNDRDLSSHRHGRTELCVRLLSARRPAFEGEILEGCDLSSLRVLMCAAEPVKAETFTKFLEAFQPYGLKSESFYAAYGLAENTLAVSLGGRTIVSRQQACADTRQSPYDLRSLRNRRIRADCQLRGLPCRT